MVVKMADQDLQFLVVFLNIILLPDNLPKQLSFIFMLTG